MHVLLAAAFGPVSAETAILYMIAVACFVLAAFAGSLASRFPGGAVSLAALGLALWLWPLMWTTAAAAF